MPGTNALLLRTELPALKGPGGLIPKSLEWLAPVVGRDAYNATDYRWTFPWGSTLSFGYLGRPYDELRYQGLAFHFIGYDELTQFGREGYTWMLNRLRRDEGSQVPLRVMSTSNPGGPGHAWVRQRFLREGAAHGRRFIPAKLADNPYLDVAAYLPQLAALDPVTRARLLEGDWDVAAGGGLFDRTHWRVVRRASLPGGVKRMIRAWDLAATPEQPGTDPDWTVGVRMLFHPDVADEAGHSRDHTVDHIARFRKAPGGVEDMLRWVDSADPPECEWVLEQEPGSSGKAYAQHLLRNVIGRHRRVRFEPSTGSKLARAGAVSSASEARRLQVTDDAGDLTAWFDELESFDGSGHGHDDQVDALAAAYAKLDAPPRVMFDGGIYVMER